MTNDPSTPEAKRYEYEINLDSSTAKARVARMVGRGKAVLEVGCASGAMTRCLASQLNCRVTAIEVNEVDAHLAAPHCDEIHVGDVELMDLTNLFGERKFDVITFADVLEHLKDPVATLAKMRAFLAREGCVVASVPNIAHAALVFELARGDFDYRPVGLLDESHIRFFTRRTLLSNFERAGYAVIDIERVVVEPRYTEFDVEPRDEAERVLLRTLLERHPESRTYQFVVKAVPVDAQLGGIALATDLMRRSLDDMQRRLDEESRRRKEVESELAWIGRQWPVRLLRRARRLLGG